MRKKYIFVLALMLSLCSCSSVNNDSLDAEKAKTDALLERAEKTGKHLDSILNWQHRLLDTLRMERKVRIK